MNNIVLTRSIRNSRAASIILPLLYPALCTSRAASLNSAIHHGIRRSKGVGFRGKERSGTQDASQSYGERGEINRASVERPRSSRPQMRNVGTNDNADSFSFGPRKAVGNRPRTASRFGKELSSKEGKDAIGGKGRIIRSFGGRTARPHRDSDRSTSSRRDTKDYKRERPSEEISSGQQPSNRKPKYPSLSSKNSAYDPSSRASNREEQQFIQKATRQNGSQERSSRFEDSRKSSRQYGSQERDFKSEDNGRSTKQYGRQEGGLGSDDNGPLSRHQFRNSNRDGDSPSQSRIDTRIPVSIPYTTTASEFLYGTSVVEAALSSRREPRRKHYKLYIYNGENREGSNVERDAGLERLAKKNGVEVVRVSGDWLRVMDKMSGGRPHNGYILEASPLPRKPITSLGEYTTTDGRLGFKVALDHQSREEATVNGTDDFIKYVSQTPERKPLVLLLDSIVDPGNLGGIIRTASFLGVTAIAVSTRNSASFTSVVLKASAGASENVTIFSVNKPGGFLVDSKAAGWKIFAAVAPSGRNDPHVPQSMTTEELEDPLSEDPCILMLGGEGEGLRWNLRSKADVDLSIRGSGRSHNVDSLNVSVAAGILIDSFLKRSNAKKDSSLTEGPNGEGNMEPAGDLF